MGCTVSDGSFNAQKIQNVTKNILNTITDSMKEVIEKQGKGLQNGISHHLKMIRQSMNEQTKYLKQIANNTRKYSNQSEVIFKTIKNHQLRINKELILEDPQIENAKKPLLNELVLRKDSEINYKERLIQVPIYINFNKKGQPRLDKWIVKLYQTINQQSFYGLSNQLMNQSETKAFYSKNLLHNFINLLKIIKEQDKDYQLINVFQIFQKKSKKILKYQKLKYPQASKIIISQSINNLIESCSKHEDPQHNLVRNTGVKFIWNNKKNYNRQIKLFLNILMKKVGAQFKNFESQLKNIFKKNQQNEKDKQNNQNMKKVNREGPQKLLQEQIQYLHHKIGTKINTNVPLFQEKSDNIIIPNSQILRVIIKWIQHLKEKLNNPQQNILDRIHPFTGKQQLEINLDSESKKQIYRRFNEFIKKNNKNNQKKSSSKYENQILNYIERNKSYLSFINEQQIQVGLTAHLLSEQVTKLAVNQLNQLIHKILSFQQFYKPDDKKNKDQKQQTQLKKTFYDINYVSFNVFDLMRAQCTGTIQQIKQVYMKIRETKQFKIIRVKNRLQTGNRDFLINFRYKDTLICQLQLGLKLGEEQKKLTYTAKFNHFLYQLQRTIYDPLREAAYIVIQQLENYNKIKDFLKAQRKQVTRINKIKLQQNQNKINIGEQLFKKEDLEEENLIYICKQCYQISYDAKFIKNQNYYCCRCVIQKFDTKNICEIVIGDSFQGKEVDQIDQNEYYVLVNKNNIRRKNLVIGKNEFYIDLEQNLYNIINKNLSGIPVKKLKEDHEFVILKNESKFKYISESIKGKIKNQDPNKLQFDIEYFRKQIFTSLIQKQNKKEKVKEWIKNQIHEINFDNWKLPENQFKDYLEKFQKITILNMSDNQLNNIKFLDIINSTQQNLDNLQKLTLDKNSQINIQVLAKFKSIKRLSLSNIGLKRFQLSDCLILEYLDLSYNRLSDVNFSKLTRLRHLNIKNNSITKLDISKNTILQYLNAVIQYDFQFKYTDIIHTGQYDTSIERIEYIGIILQNNLLKKLEIKNLKQLIFQQVKINEAILIIQNQKKLKRIQISPRYGGEKIKLRHLESIQMICIDNITKIELQIQESSFMTHLKKLILCSVSILDLKIQKCSQLEEIIIQNTQNSNGVLELPQLTNLKYILLQQTTIKQFNIEGQSNLQQINLRNMQISNQILQIPQMRNLKKLYLNYLNFNKLRIEKSQNLEQIQLTYINLNNDGIVMIPQLKELKYLKLEQIKVNELKLEQYPCLQKIHLKEVQMTKILVIEDFRYLKQINLNSINLNSLTINNLPQLSNLYLAGISIPDGFFKISSNKNLKIMRIVYIISFELIIENLPEIQQIALTSINSTKMITISQFKKLKNIQMRYINTQLNTSINSGLCIKKCLNLQQIRLEQFNGQLIISEMDNLKKLVFKQIQLDKVQNNKGLIIPEPKILKSLELQSIEIQELKLDKYPFLQQICLQRVKFMKERLIIPELKNLKILRLTQIQITELKLDVHPFLQQVTLWGINILNQQLTIPQLTNLKILKLTSITITQLKMNIQKCPYIQEVQLQKIITKSDQILKLPQLKKLKKLRLSQITVDDVKIEQYPCLQQLQLIQIKMIKRVLIIPHQVITLKKLILVSLTLNQLKIGKCPALQQLQLQKINIAGYIVLPQLLRLRSIMILDLKIKQIILNNMLELSIIIIQRTQILNSLIISKLPNLVNLTLQQNMFEKIKIQFSSVLQTFESTNNNKGKCKLDNFKQQQIQKDFKFQQDYSKESQSKPISKK